MKKQTLKILIFVRVILLLLSLFAYTYGRFSIFLFFSLLFIWDIIKIVGILKRKIVGHTKFEKAGGVALVVDGMLTLLLWSMLGPGAHSAIYYKSEELRYHILEGRYKQAAEQVLPYLEETNGENYKSYEVNFPLLTDASFLIYRKNEEDILLMFGTGNTDRVTGIAYFSNENAWKMMGNFRYREKVDENWAVYTTA